MKCKIPKVDYLDLVGTGDPGDTTGLAFWEGTLYPKYESFHWPSRYKNIIDQINWMSDNLFGLLDFHAPKLMIFEQVQFWEGSLNSVTSAKRGNLFKLAYLLGSYIRVCKVLDIQVKLILSQDWKGQMDDDAVAARVRLINGQCYPNPHVCDAVGMGLNEVGLFKRLGWDLCK